MNTVPKRALIAATLAAALVGLSATAVAQSTTTPAPAAQTPQATQQGQYHAQRAEHMARMQQRMAERQAALKAELKITAEQEPAWNAFVARTSPEARQALQNRQGLREDWSKLTTPQRLDKMAEMRAQREARMVQRHDAIKSFYAVLTPEQQKVFDQKQMQGFQRAGMKGEGKKHRHQHHHNQNHHDRGMHQRMGGTV